MSSASADWTDAKVAQLRTLWAEGMPVNAIGVKLGMSKNAVVGKAHRLHLPSRPSPIRTDGAPRIPPRPKPIKLPNMAVTPNIAVRKPILAAPPLPAEPSPKPTPIMRVSNSEGCRYVVDETRRAVRYCDAVRTSMSGKAGDTVPSSYCAEHHALCFIGRRSSQPAPLPW